MLAEDPDQFQFGNKGYLGGGGGNEAVRKNFLACAFWNANLQSDADGKGRRPVHGAGQPDPLSRHRRGPPGPRPVRQRAVRLSVAKPLLVEPALPRFANGDHHLIARAVVQNQTAQAGDVLVTLELDPTARPAGMRPSPTRPPRRRARRVAARWRSRGTAPRSRSFRSS